MGPDVARKWIMRLTKVMMTEFDMMVKAAEGTLSVSSYSHTRRRGRVNPWHFLNHLACKPWPGALSASIRYIELGVTWFLEMRLERTMLRGMISCLCHTRRGTFTVFLFSGPSLLFYLLFYFLYGLLKNAHCLLYWSDRLRWRYVPPVIYLDEYH
jgi:hypothetical protein